jgi:hypothetical protein
MTVFAILFLFLFLLRFEAVAKVVEEWTGISWKKLQNIAGIGMMIIVGYVFVSWGIAALAVPFVGVPLLIGGLAVLAYAVWSIYQDYFSIERKFE